MIKTSQFVENVYIYHLIENYRSENTNINVVYTI